VSIVARTLKLVRVVHRYLGAFTAPAVLFFAFTGALQTLSLHEAAKDGHYQPPAWLMATVQLHKKQTFHIQPKKTTHGEITTIDGDLSSSGGKHNPKEIAGGAAPKEQPAKKSVIPMKAFFVLVSVALILSTLTGLQTAWAFARQRRVLVFTVIAGALLPIALLFV